MHQLEVKRLIDDVHPKHDADRDSLLDEMESLYGGYSFYLYAKNKLFK
jgi:hypothetical protein